MRVNRKVLGGLLTACVVGSVLASQPLGAAPDVSLQAWTCNGIPATIVGTPAGETLTGTPGADVIVAREGNDTIRGLGGDDIICAGKGNDIVYGGAGFDILYGAQGNDLLYSKNGATAFQRADNRGARMFGGADDDKIYGSNKWDRMQGGPGNDQLFGYEGRDWLRAGPGNDAVDGGAGIDDQHGGNGRDDIQVTTGDIVRGGAGLDLCRLTGEPALLRSCGRNIRETPPHVKVVVVGQERGEDETAINAALDVIGAREGIVVEYIGLDPGERSDRLDDAVTSGEPPVVLDPSSGNLVAADIAFLPNPGLIADLVGAGVAVPAAPATVAAVAAGWSEGWIARGRVGDTLYAVPNKSDLKSLVWYRPSAFVDPTGSPYAIPATWTELNTLTDQIIANGQTPWCVGIESGQATGWMFTDWVEDRLLGSQPTSLYDDWVANDVGFTDPRIRDAWNDVLDIWNRPGAVFEALGGVGGAGIISTHFIEAAMNLVNDECLMHKQANFFSSLVGGAEDLSVFEFPGDAGNDVILGAGTYATSFNGHADVALVHEFLATAEYADARHELQPQGFLSAVAGQDLSLLLPREQQMTQILQTADNFRFDGSDLMPSAVGSALEPGGFWYEGSRAVLGHGNVSPPFTGATVNAATQNVQNQFCVVTPTGASCP